MVEVRGGGGVRRLRELLAGLMLPRGYPGTVSDDYAAYQLWDTVQAFCSSVTGALAQHAVLKGVGVGSEAATALSATQTYLMRDGVGMLASIAFAATRGSDLDNNAKQWRLVADVLNDAAMLVELLSPAFPQLFVLLVCIASLSRAVVGVAGGATRAALTQHQARAGNAADVSAKDGSQETMVNLLALAVNLVLMPLVADHPARTWGLFGLFTCCHIAANWRAVRALQLDRFNVRRAELAIAAHAAGAAVPSPAELARTEPLLPPADPGGVALAVGCPLSHAAPTAGALASAAAMIGPHRRHSLFVALCARRPRVAVCLHAGATAGDVLRAYYEASTLRIAATGGPASPGVAAALQAYRDGAGSDSAHRALVQAVARASDAAYDDFAQQAASAGWELACNQLGAGHSRLVVEPGAL